MYEITWTRFFSLTFGATTYSTTTELTAFMAGLAFGSLLLGKIADRVKQRRCAFLKWLVIPPTLYPPPMGRLLGWPLNDGTNCAWIMTGKICCCVPEAAERIAGDPVTGCALAGMRQNDPVACGADSASGVESLASPAETAAAQQTEDHQECSTDFGCLKKSNVWIYQRFEF